MCKTVARFERNRQKIQSSFLFVYCHTHTHTHILSIETDKKQTVLCHHHIGHLLYILALFTFVLRIIKQLFIIFLFVDVCLLFHSKKQKQKQEQKSNALQNCKKITFVFRTFFELFIYLFMCVLFYPFYIHRNRFFCQIFVP